MTGDWYDGADTEGRSDDGESWDRQPRYPSRGQPAGPGHGYDEAPGGYPPPGQAAGTDAWGRPVAGSPQGGYGAPDPAGSGGYPRAARPGGGSYPQPGTQTGAQPGYGQGSGAWPQGEQRRPEDSGAQPGGAGSGGGGRRRARPAAEDPYAPPPAVPPPGGATGGYATGGYATGHEAPVPPQGGGGGRRRAGGARQPDPRQPDPRQADPYGTGAHGTAGPGDPRHQQGPGGGPGYGAPPAPGRPDSGSWDRRQVPGPRQRRPSEGAPVGDPRMPEPRRGDPRAVDPRAADPRAGAPQAAEPRAGGRRRAAGAAGEMGDTSGRYAPGAGSGAYGTRPVGEPRRPGDDAPRRDGADPYGRRSGGYDMPPGHDRSGGLNPDHLNPDHQNEDGPRDGRRQGYEAAAAAAPPEPRRGRRRVAQDRDDRERFDTGRDEPGDVATEEPAEQEQGGFGLFAGGDASDDGADTGRRGKRKGGGKRKRGGAAVLIAVLVVFAILGGLAYGGYVYYKKNFGPPPDYLSATGLPATVDVQVNTGESVTQIGQTLVSDGVVESIGAWTKAADANPKSSTIQPGLYTVHKGLSSAAAIDELLDPKNLDDKSRLLVTAGQWSSEVFAAVSQKTGWSLASIKAAATSGKVGLPSWAKNNIEGFLAPGTYNLGTKGLTPTTLLAQMVTSTMDNLSVAGVTPTAAKSLGLSSPEDLLIVASLARAEALYSGDLPKVAQVVYNRLNTPITNGYLQFDTPLLYGFQQRHRELSYNDLHNDSGNKYNVFQYKGLPPGPIDSPDLDSLKAAVHPTGGPQIAYFCTINQKTGDTRFVDTFDELSTMEAKYPDCKK